MPPTLATSFFLPGIISKSPALGISNCSAPHLCPPSSDPESTDLRNMACAELRELWALPLPVRLCLGTEMDGWMVLWEKFLSSNQTLIPVPRPHPSPWVGKMQRMVDWQDLIPNSCLASAFPRLLAHPGALQCGSCCALVLHRASHRLASQSLRPTQFPTWRLNTRFH